ncbi:putative acyl-CoA synthetase YngI [Lasiodiplodia hormozganensis]|uniref:Acyl-CoA synthetase YngI n=1 Tax=Lasiodiplodia hormozganensis TaxID=869390 RepID=A0AA39YAP8_9PEZI|nr:putative acyl-CoA synthetase YngI [Lasiodiplodia hormozganensis]
MAVHPTANELSLVHGRTDEPLWEKTLADLVNEQEEKFGGKTAVRVPWQNVELTYSDLAKRSLAVARGLLAHGLMPGDYVGIFAGNRYEYIEAFLGATCIGCPVVVLNNTYTPQELARSLMQTCTTGTPKAAMLTHRNILNNAHLVGARLGLTPSSTICCPPPLFHCFGLVMGFLAALAHGAAIVFPADAFDAGATVAAVARERCDVLLGVPTMLLAVLEEAGSSRSRKEGGGGGGGGGEDAKTTTTTTVRTVLAAGSLVAAPLMERLRREMGVRDVLVAYGMTETSPVSFMTARRGDRGSVEEEEEEEEEGKRGGGGLGMVMPHTSAKVVDGKGRVVPRGVRGELCTSGYLLMKGYLGNENATREVMERDESGRVWMRTGDECVIDESGACSITGRIKDIIIRGGENIFPAEIEERLAAHPLVAEACVVGVKDEKYGEVVGCFLRAAGGGERPDDANLQSWVKEALGRHKSPQWIFWIGDSGVGPDYPKTGSGKHQKHILRALANKLVGAKSFKARL